MQLLPISKRQELVNQLITIINDSDYSDDPQLLDDKDLLEQYGTEMILSDFSFKMKRKQIRKRILIVKSGKVNTPSASPNYWSYEDLNTINDFLLERYDRKDINDVSGYKGKYWIYDGTPNEIRVYFYKNNDQIFVEINDETISL